jgi:hypothetical protein
MDRRAFVASVAGVLLAGPLAAVGPHLRVAHASVSWYLLVPPADYSKETHQYTRVEDAPLVQWYRDGEYDPERECHRAGVAKATEAKRLSLNVPDADHFYHVEAWALEHGRCISNELFRKPVR